MCQIQGLTLKIFLMDLAPARTPHKSLSVFVFCLSFPLSSILFFYPSLSFFCLTFFLLSLYSIPVFISSIFFFYPLYAQASLQYNFSSLPYLASIPLLFSSISFFYAAFLTFHLFLPSLFSSHPSLSSMSLFFLSISYF